MDPMNSECSCGVSCVSSEERVEAKLLSSFRIRDPRFELMHDDSKEPGVIHCLSQLFGSKFSMIPVWQGDMMMCEFSSGFT